MNPTHRSAADLFLSWREDVLHGDPPTRWPCGDGELGRIEIGPGRVLLLGGAPGAGKSALVAQIVVEALRRTPTLRALILNVEMPPTALLERQLARLSGVDLTAIMRRETTADDRPRLEAALDDLAALADRFAFASPSADLATIAKAADDFEADLIVLDYVQRIRPPGKSASRRESIDAAMERIREWANKGTAIIAVAALARQKSDKGQSTYAPETLNLASFRESSELEFGADDAFILAPADDADAMILKHLKSRYGETRDLHLRFDRKRQNFLDDLDGAAWAEASKPTRDDFQADLAAARGRANRERGLKVAKPTDRYGERKDLE